MFTIDPKITAIDLKKKNIIKVLLSMNTHQVATPETRLEEARSYVFFAHEGRNRVSAHIGLHLLHTERNLFYAHSTNPFLENELKEVEEEARYFAEDLGAMLDEVDFANLSETEQDRWIDAQSIFNQKKQPEAAPVEQNPKTAETVAAATTVQPRTAPVQPVTQAIHPAAVKQKPPQEVPVDAQVRQAKDTPLATAKRRQEIEQKAETAGVEKTPKPTERRKSVSATGVVSRDREALARLLTSF